jgi:riboflavin transporter FmnP
VKRRPSLVGALGALILVFHYLDTAWLLFPNTASASVGLLALFVAGIVVVVSLVWVRARRLTHRAPFSPSVSH